MNNASKKKLAVATVVYWFLLGYIIAILFFWFFVLERQNTQMSNYRLNELKMDDPAYEKKAGAIAAEKRLKTTQYLGEGITFLAMILVGALFVYRAVRKQIILQQQQQNFMMAVTHELKTPIAVAKLNLETMQKHQLDETRKQKILQMTLQEINRLNNLASNILVSSQLEGGRYRVGKEELDFSDLVSSCVNDYINRFPERTWVTDITNELDVKGDALLLQILVNNLLENAMKYSPKEAPITCRLVKDNKKIILSVLDEGSGIPDNEKQKIFDKFYRIGNEETRTAKGTGIGLYLCSKIADDHNADIRVTDNHPTGANFSIRFSV
ncbi:MAG: two-component sensor histidine kinase [Chitinophagaceae bacterium]|nr:MAG: two-component sensor histidine kinase [Chitinophagaceae bacterium]